MSEDVKKNEVKEVNPEPAMSAKFTEYIMKEFTSSAGKLEVTDFQKRLIQGYFIGVDRALKVAEENRVRKNESNKDHKWDNDLPVIWNNVNLPALAVDLVSHARVGLDMSQDNHLTPIPYKNRKTNKYDITLMPGYVGIQYVALKYAMDRPKSVRTELVYSTDVFIPTKKDMENAYDTYEFQIKDPFTRGDLVGGFGYIEYKDPTMNKLIIMTKADIEKRKPKYAAPEFWGGTKTEWKNGKQEETEIDGWYDEMCLKTLIREVYKPKHIPRDPMKIDEAYQNMKAQENKYIEIQTEAVIEEQGNRTLIDVSDGPGSSFEPDTAINQEPEPIPETAPMGATF